MSLADSPTDSYAYVASRRDSIRSHLRRQMVQVDGPKVEGETAVYRNALASNALLKPIEGASTIYEIFEYRLRRIDKSKRFLGKRSPGPVDPATGKPTWSDYTWESFETVSQRRLNFGYGLRKLWADVIKGDDNEKWTLGLYAHNRPEWVIADYACQSQSLITVSLFDTLGPESIEYILNHANIKVVAASLLLVPKLLKVAHNCPQIKLIICMDPLDDTALVPGLPRAAGVVKQWAAEKGITLVSFKDVEDLGKAHPLSVRPPKPDDICSIMYTSGTTGKPKGAILLHRNFGSLCSSRLTSLDFSDNDVYISYLPLAHIYERSNIVLSTFSGTSIGFFRGDTSLLFEDIALLRPTVFASVPRLLNRIHAAVLQKTVYSGNAITATLFQQALNAKLAGLQQGHYTHALWDRLVFNKIKGLLGGNIRIITTGSAPISKDVLGFLKVTFCCDVLEGYGATENMADGSLNWRGDNRNYGKVGAISPCCECKLVDIPDMKYLSTDQPFPRGELWIRGGSVFAGYLHDEAKTRETLTEDGWLKTGDVCLIDQNGRIQIIDRKKQIFKLAQGEYIAPEKLENIFVQSPLVAQIFIHGDSLQSELVCIVVPSPDQAVKFAIEKGYLPKSTPIPEAIAQGQAELPEQLKALVANEKFKQDVLNDITSLAKINKLAGFETPKAIFLDTEVMTIDNNLLTPTLKLKRDTARDKYQKQIEEMYATLHASRSISDVAAKL
ncbi:uncharacterized protein BJ171DRAFT_137214 [Polychytrium aggregatum]|uniref:uncharacterized protein n=1 Tax=Polychytrium aggregatum TaxID=110093 RepID=UPI0022FEE46D|nr:uncharacterized protein BJ171DRAFT_137214 [Polychytrium aggregatum]KAI9203595.1 hypothetical protein BJ171DRAFT_137214 [Polychytrium aggregatum]